MKFSEFPQFWREYITAHYEKVLANYRTSCVALGIEGRELEAKVAEVAEVLRADRERTCAEVQVLADRGMRSDEETLQ